MIRNLRRFFNNRYFNAKSLTGFLSAVLLMVYLKYRPSPSLLRSARSLRETSLLAWILPDPCDAIRRDGVIHVVTSGDKGTYPAMVTLATSVVINTRSDVMFHFITDDTQVADLRAILQSCFLKNASYRIVPFTKTKLDGKFVVRTYRRELANAMNFVRLYLPELLPCVDHVAYIDVDCVVLGDIKELYHTQLDDNAVVAVLEQKKKYVGSLIDLKNPHVKNNTSIRPTQEIINAGVFVANLTRWRTRNITAQLDHWMKLNVRSPIVKYSNNGAGSQAIMQLGLSDKYTPLNSTWNVLYLQHSRYVKISPSVKLLHWNGPQKPWNDNSTKHADIWFSYFHLALSNLPIPLNISSQTV